MNTNSEIRGGNGIVELNEFEIRCVNGGCPARVPTAVVKWVQGKLRDRRG